MAFSPSNWTQRNLGWLGNLERRLSQWLYLRMLDRIQKSTGGLQWCPWCKQCVQAYDGSHFTNRHDITVDALHCGNCGGVSRWRFEHGMLPLDPIGLTSPLVKVVVDHKSDLTEALEPFVRSVQGWDETMFPAAITTEAEGGTSSAWDLTFEDVMKARDAFIAAGGKYKD